MAEKTENRAWLRIVDGPSEEWHLDPDFNPITFQMQDPEALTQPYRVDFVVEEATEVEGLLGAKKLIGTVLTLGGGQKVTAIYNWSSRSGWVTWTW